MIFRVVDGRSFDAPRRLTPHRNKAVAGRLL